MPRPNRFFLRHTPLNQLNANKENETNASKKKLDQPTKPSLANRSWTKTFLRLFEDNNKKTYFDQQVTIQVYAQEGPLDDRRRTIDLLK